MSHRCVSEEADALTATVPPLNISTQKPFWLLYISFLAKGDICIFHLGSRTMYIKAYGAENRLYVRHCIVYCCYVSVRESACVFSVNYV